MCWLMSHPDGWKGILAGITGYVLQTLYLFSSLFGNLTAAAWQRMAVRQRLVMKRRATPSLVPLTNESRQRWSGSPPDTARTSQMKKKKGLANARPILPSHSLSSWMASWEMWAPRGVHCENQRSSRPLVWIENFKFGAHFFSSSLPQDHGLFTEGQPSQQLWVKESIPFHHLCVWWK